MAVAFMGLGLDTWFDEPAYKATKGSFSSKGAFMRTLDLGTANTVAGMEWLLAHELGHHIGGHVNAYLEQEMEANATAVRVLQVWGRSEEEAVRLAGNILLSVKRNGSTLTGKGHDWCAEFADLRARYPQYTLAIRSGSTPSVRERAGRP